MTKEECTVSIDLARGVAMVLKECAVVKHSPGLFENRKTKAEAIFALCMEVKRLQMAYTAHDDALKDALADALCWMQLAAKLAGDLKAVLSCRPVDRIGCAEDLAAYDAMVKEQGE